LGGRATGFGGANQVRNPEPNLIRLCPEHSRRR
jgi:hypothetical protein